MVGSERSGHHPEAALRRSQSHDMAGHGREDAMVAAMKRFWNDESGATAVEYGLMVALIAVVIIVAVALIGTNLSEMFTDVAGSIDGL
jgi:pilus assembly protein Flp/PilA